MRGLSPNTATVTQKKTRFGTKYELFEQRFRQGPWQGYFRKTGLSHCGSILPMVDQGKESTAEVVAASAARISDSKGLVAIGVGLGWGIAALAIAAVFVAIALGSKWDGRLFPEPNCFELQEVSGRLFSINTCTGEATQIDVIEVESVQPDPDQKKEEQL